MGDVQQLYGAIHQRPQQLRQADNRSQFVRAGGNRVAKVNARPFAAYLTKPIKQV